MKRTLLGVLILTLIAVMVIKQRSSLERTPPAVADSKVFNPETGVISLVDSAAFEANSIIEKDVAIVTRDGTRLSANVFRPKADGQHPVVMSFTAYNKDGGLDQYPAVLNVAGDPDFNLGKFAISKWTAWEAPDPIFWVTNGYAVIYVDTRGYGASEGEANVLSQRDGEDFYDAIEWAGQQSWSNGNIGLNGVSYLAISQWVAASSNPPSLKAIIPWEGQSDNFREVLFHGGIPETAFSEFWLTRISRLAHKSPVPPPFIVRLGKRYPLWMKRIQAWAQPPSGINLPEIKVPALICATWSDQGLHTRGSFEGFKQIASSQKWLFTHGRPKWETYYSPEALENQLNFFDHFLKGAENGFDTQPPVRLEVRESLDNYSVRYVEDWPIPQTDYQRWYLQRDEQLSRASASSPLTLAYDSLKGATKFSHTFSEDTEISGNIKLRLWVSTDDTDDMDLFVGINKRDTNGAPVHFYAKTGFNKGPVAMGWLRASHRELDETRSTPQQPVLAHERTLELARGEIVPVEIEVLPSSTLFKAGESLELVVQGRDLFEHPMLAHKASVNEGEHKLHIGGEYDSYLLLPVIP